MLTVFEKRDEVRVARARIEPCGSGNARALATRPFLLKQTA